MSRSAKPCPLPPETLLARYCDGAGTYTDSFVIEAPGAIALHDLVEAFYSSPAFKLELLVVGILFGKRWSDRQAGQLARCETADFSAWRVWERTADQLLMREIISDKTRSWLMVQPQRGEPAPTTRVYFGTAVLPVGEDAKGRPRMSVLFAPLLVFHRLYSRLLLGSAVRRLGLGRTGQARLSA
jgi:hypothetical protein